MKTKCIIMAMLIVILMTPMNVEAGQKQAKDMKGIDLAEYRNSNIDEIKEVVKLTKDKKKKNRYYDKHKTTYITVDKSGDIIRITIKGTSKKAQKYAPTFGGVALANDGCMVDYNIENEGIFSIYEDPYTKGEAIENEDEDYIIYAQERDSNNTITIKSKLLKWQHSDKKVYQILWKKDGVTAKNRQKYEYHDVNAELENQEKEVQEAESSQKGTESANFGNEGELSLAEKIGMYQEQCIYIEDTAELLRNPSTYDGQQILVKGHINPVTEELLSLDSGDDIYIENRENLFDAEYNRIENILKGDIVFVAGIYHVGGIKTITKTWNCIDDAFIILKN